MKLKASIIGSLSALAALLLGGFVSLVSAQDVTRNLIPENTTVETLANNPLVTLGIIALALLLIIAVSLKTRKKGHIKTS